MTISIFCKAYTYRRSQGHCLLIKGNQEKRETYRDSDWFTGHIFSMQNPTMPLLQSSRCSKPCFNLIEGRFPIILKYVKKHMITLTRAYVIYLMKSGLQLYLKMFNVDQGFKLGRCGRVCYDIPTCLKTVRAFGLPCRNEEVNPTTFFLRKKKKKEKYLLFLNFYNK